MDVTLTDVVDGTGAELSIEPFGSKAPQVMDGEGPQVEHVVPGEGVSFLQQHHPSSQKAQLHGAPQPAWPRPDDDALRGKRTNQRGRTEQN